MTDDHLAKKHHCPREKLKLGRKEEFGEKGKNWKKRKFLEELGRSRKIGEKVENCKNCKNLEFRLY